MLQQLIANEAKDREKEPENLAYTPSQTEADAKEKLAGEMVRTCSLAPLLHETYDTLQDPDKACRLWGTQLIRVNSLKGCTIHRIDALNCFCVWH